MRTTRVGLLVCLLGILVPALHAGAQGQTGTIVGRATAASSGEGLSGVAVTVVGTERGAVTGSDGRYTITGVPAGPQRLRVSRLGYSEAAATVEVIAGGTATADLTLQPQALALEGIVAVGYGTQRRRDLTGAVASVPAEKIADLPITNVQEGLQGRVSGVQIIQNEGKPGSGYTVRIRGGNSMLGGNDPLYVIDGFPVTSTAVLSNLAPDQIEGIEILKDASATAIYGSRGANGVVIITTKRGQRGTNRADFDVYTGVQQVSRKVPMANARQFAEMANELARNEEQALPFPDLDNLPANTDWQDAFFRDAPITSYTGTFSGGDEATRYLVSGNYLDQAGLVPATGFSRSTARFNLDRKMSDRFDLATQVMLSRERQDDTPTSTEGTIFDLLGAPPTVAPFDADGGYSNIRPYFFSPNSTENPFESTREIMRRNMDNRLLGNVSAQYRFLDGLTGKVLLGTDYMNTRYDYYATRRSEAGANGGAGSTSRSEATSYLNENTLTYDHGLGANQHVNVIGGFTWQTRNYNYVGTSASGFVTDALSNHDLGAGKVASPPSTNSWDWTLVSWLGRFNYTLLDRYLFTVTGRADGSSRFGENNKWAIFPSAAFAWRVSDEPFLRDSRTVSNLKLRTSWGRTGNQDIALYQSLQRVASVGAVVGDLAVTGFAPVNVPNPDLKWETTEQLDAGMDLGLWDERLRLTTDFYRKRTSNLLAQVTLPPSSGYGTVLQNVGAIRNTGIELAVGLDVLRGSSLTWTVDANIAHNRNEVVDVAGGIEFLAPQAYHLIGPVQIVREGEPLSAFYLFEEDGLDENGLIKYKDLNGDGQITEEDRRIAGSPYPDYTFGLSTSLSWGPFDMSALVQGAQGGKIYNNNLYQVATSLSRGFNQIVDVYENHWSPENPDPNAKYPRLGLTTTFRASDRFLEDASFVRLKSVQLSYQVPLQRLSTLRMVHDASIYVAGQNLLTFTDYSWFDPEVNAFGGDSGANGNLRPGMDMFSYPKARTVTLGMKLGL